MRAEIFVLPSQEGEVRRVRQLLRANLFPELHLETRIFGLRPEAQPQAQGQREVADRYFKLLQAAAPPDQDVEFTIKSVESYGARYYVTVWFALTRKGPQSRDYYAPQHRSFHPQEFARFFPAVAVQDRMVLVPSGLGALVSGSADVSIFRPFASGGVAEVDFSDAEAAAGVIRGVALALRAEVVREIAAYSSYQPSGPLDLATVAADLELDVGYVRQCLREEGADRPLYHQLQCEVSPRRITMGRWTKVVLSVSNSTEAPLRDLTVSVSGPVKLRPAQLRTDVPAHGAGTVALALMPETRGEFPVEITFALPADQCFAGSLPVHHVWLESRPAPPRSRRR